MENKSLDFMEVRNPTSIKMDRLPAERVPIGKYYKPCLAQLPDNSLFLVVEVGNDSSLTAQERAAGKHRIDIYLFRSSDGGKTWDNGKMMNELLGREGYLTVLSDGTLVMTVHQHPWDIRNNVGYCRSFVHCSNDGGQTWTTTPIESDNMPPESKAFNSRNVLELGDGSVIAIATTSARGTSGDVIWRSHDQGRTWSEKYPARVAGSGIPEGYPYGFFAEAVLWQARSGKIYAINRVDSRYFPPPHRSTIQLDDNDKFIDQFERMILYGSTDEGRTWNQVGDLGDYGEMYPAVRRLRDGRLLLTFTVRELRPPLGLRAILGREEDDGFCFDFEHDRVMIDTKTPTGTRSGGGFGNTIQLVDGTLVSCYSYRGADEQSRTEVVRWHLP
jgi:hypothetical protein